MELLIGAFTPAVHRVYEILSGFPNQPCALKTLKTGLGWALLGPDEHLKPCKSESENSVCFARYEQCDLQGQLQQLFNQEFADESCADSTLSLNDKAFLDKGGMSITRVN